MSSSSIEFLKVIYRKGDQLDPYVFIKETLKVVGNRVILKEIPDSFQKVSVKDESGISLNETKSPFPNVNEYNVDYNRGIVHFNVLNDGKSFTFTYYGKGVVLINADRIMDKNGETIGDVIDYINSTLVEEGQDWGVE